MSNWDIERKYLINKLKIEFFIATNVGGVYIY